MKIGILTFHFGNNYGGILQCYALQQVLKKEGYIVEVINFQPSSEAIIDRIKNKLKQIGSYKEFVENIGRLCKAKNKPIHIEYANEIKRQFNLFRNEYIKLSQPLNEDNIGLYVKEHYDAIIVGSDQVWTSLYDKIPIYFMGWLPEFDGLKLSYAACSAHKYVRGKRKEELKSLLEKFSYISVRDSVTAELVSNIIEKTPDIVPDPTELYDFKEFISENKYGEPYILTYVLGDEIDGGHEVALSKIKRITGVEKVIAIVIPNNNLDIVNYTDDVLYHVSPAEWINLFYHASAVYTDSFHAIMFSLKFSKPFIAYYKNAIRSSRLIDLKERRGISCIIENIYEVPEKLEIHSSKLNSFDFKRVLNNDFRKFI